MGFFRFPVSAVRIFFQNPKKAYENLSKKVSVTEAFLWYLIPTIILYLILGVALITTGEIPTIGALGTIFMFIIAIIFITAFYILFIFIYVGIVHLSYKIVGGDASFKRAIVMVLGVYLGYSILLLPLNIIYFLGILMPNVIAIIITIITLLLILATFIWYAIVVIKNFAKFYNISIGKSTLAFFIPIIAALVLMFVLIFIGVFLGILVSAL